MNKNLPIPYFTVDSTIEEPGISWPKNQDCLFQYLRQYRFKIL